MPRIATLRSRSVRALLLGLLVAVLATYLLIGHALHAPNDGMKSMHGDGICLVLFVLALGFTARLREAPPRPADRVPVRLVSVVLVPRAAAPPMPARASPAWLQSFRR